MDKELAMKIVSENKDINKISDFMKETNSLFISNNKNKIPPFSKSDIVTAEFSDYIRENCTEKEKDLIIINEFLIRVHNKVHIGIMTLKETVNETEKKDITILLKSLKNLELLHLIEDGLDKKTLKIMKEIQEENKENKKPKIK